MTKITILVLFKLKKKGTSKYWIQWKLSWAATLREALTGYKVEGHPKTKASPKYRELCWYCFKYDATMGFLKKIPFWSIFFIKGGCWIGDQSLLANKKCLLLFSTTEMLAERFICDTGNRTLTIWARPLLVNMYLAWIKPYNISAACSIKSLWLGLSSSSSSTIKKHSH